MILHTLHLEQPAADVLACALLQAVDDLEARAIIAEHHDPTLGPASAAEYRTDIQRLRLVLDAIADDHRTPAPERAAVLWIDGTWTVNNGRPVRLHRQDDLEGLLESGLDLVHHRLLDAHDVLIAIHHLVATDRLHLATTTDLVHRTDDLATNHDATTNDESTAIVQTTMDIEASCLPTPQAAHRVAPGCGPAPAHGAETGAARC